jgi:hypothetical protein
VLKSLITWAPFTVCVRACRPAGAMGDTPGRRHGAAMTVVVVVVVASAARCSAAAGALRGFAEAMGPVQISTARGPE